MTDILKALTRIHQEYQITDKHLDLLDKMTRGGSCVDTKIKANLLVNPDHRPNDIIAERLKVAPYINHLGTILLKLVSQLVSHEAGYTSNSNDLWWQESFFNESGLVPNSQSRVSFQTFLQHAMLEALIQGKAIAQIDTTLTNNSISKIEQKNAEGDKPYLLLRKRRDLRDWKIDEKGFVFAKLHTLRINQDSWDSHPKIEHEFLIYQRKGDNSIVASRYLISPKNSDITESNYSLDNLDTNNAYVDLLLPETEIFHVFDNRKPLFKFPLVMISLPQNLWLADQLFDIQKSYFNHTAALEWALISTNYAQLIFEDVEDEKEIQSRLGLAGNGYWWGLPSGVKAKWLERGSNGIELAIKYRDNLKKEMFEVINQIAATLTNSYSAISRSGESKKEDRRNFEILLQVYGQHLREFAKNILDVASIARGEILDWNVTGFSNYNSDSFLDDLREYQEAEEFLNSPTFTKEARKQLAAKAVSALNLPKDTLPTIQDEIS